MVWRFVCTKTAFSVTGKEPLEISSQKGFSFKSLFVWYVLDREKRSFNLVPRVLETRLTELFENADVTRYCRRPFSMEQRVERDKTTFRSQNSSQGENETQVWTNNV